jgi:nifR3 family TIM-barrel protein
MSISIGKLRLEPPLFLGPMEGITDVPFRRIARKGGCGVLCTQMIHASFLLRSRPEKIREVADLDASEHPVGMQLAGENAVLMGEAARKAEQSGAAFVDINMGCPAPKVVSLGCGAALMKNPALAGKIVGEVKRSVSIPVTVKIRAGWNDETKTAPEVSAIVQSEGADLITVHPRTRAQRFKGAADWSLIGEIKRRASIPVVGNGDIFASDDIGRMRRETGCDGVMIARAALGNPWIFGSARPSPREIKETMIEHLDHHLSFYSMRPMAMLTFRKHLVWYTKGLRGSAEFRRKVFQEKSVVALLEMTERYFDTCGENHER